MKQSFFRYEGHNYLVPFLIISSLFFMCGFAHGFIEVLNPQITISPYGGTYIIYYLCIRN